MVRGLYTGASAMLAEMHEMNVIANNLANVDQTGFKRDAAISKAFPEMLLSRINDDGVTVLPFGSSDDPATIGRLGTGVEINEIFPVFEQGTLKEARGQYDLALNGKGFFSVETPDGVRYTRNGNFTRSVDGYLVTHNGDFVLGEQGRIKVQDFNVKFDGDGTVYRNPNFAESPDKLLGKNENSWEDRQVIDRLRLVSFENLRELKKKGNSYWAESEFSGPAQPLASLPEAAGTRLRQGFLESSNVKVVNEMVAMIAVNRAYEANQKSVRSHDEALGRLVNDVARLG